MIFKKLPRATQSILVLAVVLLLGQFILQVYLARTDSRTTDEGVHLSAGYTYVVKHDFRFNPEHPPLIKLLAGLPMLVLKPHEPQDQSLWEKGSDFFYDNWKENRQYGDQFLYTSGNNADQLLFWGRIPIVFTTLLLGILLFWFAWTLFGPVGALLTLVTYVFNPTVTAHGHLVTTDVPVALAYVGTLWAFWRFLQKPTITQTAILGVVFGLAQLTKFTAIMLVVILPILFVWYLVIHKQSRPQWLSYVGKMLLAVLVSWVVIWIGYGMPLHSVPNIPSVSNAVITGNSLQQYVSSNSNPTIDHIYSSLRPILIPPYYIKGLLMVFIHVGGGHDSYLLGMNSSTGWWYYFPVVFFFKTPIALLVLYGLGIWQAIVSRKNRPVLMMILIASTFYLLFAMTSKANLGVRHVMPLFPLLGILVGAVTLVKSDKIHKLVAVLAALIIIEFVMQVPSFLPYANQFIGGSNYSYKIASDSNTDWGQDLKRIKQYVDANHIADPYILYPWDGDDALRYHGLVPKGLPQDIAEARGIAIVSSSWLDSKEYKSLRSLQPIDHITPSVLVYDLGEGR